MNSPSMNRAVLATAFALGLIAIVWVGSGFVGTSGLALAMTAGIAAVYLLGALEVRRFRSATASLSAALADIPKPLNELGDWLGRLPAPLRNTVRQRIEGERAALPGLALTPYLIGLLVMLGMLGTFLGMVITFKGAVFALEGSADLQAIRSALAAPIKGLGLAFGTSVAGVATSAMLGLMSAIGRRERLGVVRELDTCIATTLRPFSLAHQRQQTFAALQQQAGALPEVAAKLQTLMEQMEARSERLDEQLLGRQEQFHREAASAYTGLAQSVERTLTDALGASARAASESLQPVVASAMSAIATESQRQHAQVSEAVQAQLAGMAKQFSATTSTVADTWTGALQTHMQTSAQLAEGLGQTLTAFTTGFEERASALLSSVSQSAKDAQSDQLNASAQQQAAWTQSLQQLATGLQTEWSQASAQALARQQAASEALEKTASAVQQRAGEQASRATEEITRVIAQSEALLQARTASETSWTQQHGERMDQLAGLWRSELATLRGDEEARGQAAVARLGELQAALSTHLATLGTALEAPMTRLLETASEAPKAAAEVIAQLRHDMSQLTERDNTALRERTELVAHIGSLLENVQRTTGEQRAAIETLVTSASGVFDQVTQQFTATLGAQASRTDDVAAQVAGSAAELASLGEAFHHGVQLFSQSNQQLAERLQGIETALQQSMTRSDEQLAYYVAQAREVIDLSISSQQGIVEDLRQLRAQPAKRAAGSAT